MTVALTTVSSALICSITFFEPAPPTMKNSLAIGLLDGREDADALVVVVVPDGVDLRRRLQQVRGCGLAALDGEVGGHPVGDLQAATASASLKPWLRSWVSGRESIPAISATTASGLVGQLLQT